MINWKNISKTISEIIYPENTILIKNLEKELSKYKRSEKQIYYEDKYLKTDIVYSGRRLLNINKNIDVDVRNFININDYSVKNIVSDLKLNDKSDDEKVIICLKWVIDNIKYVSDSTKGVNEFWQFPYETLYYMSGDCEDMSILLTNMIIVSGVPSWKVRINAGDVDDGKGNKGGHCFTVYYSEVENKWVLLDACYWTNLLSVKDRKEYKDESFYITTWFSFSKDYCWYKDIKDIPKLESIKNI